MAFPTLLSIAGSDSCGGAGIQADIKTASALGVYAMTVVTAVTAQNTFGISHMHCLPFESVRRQLESVFEDIRPDAVKIGLIPSAETAAVVSEFLTHNYNGPVVIDPVMASSSGCEFTDGNTLPLLKRRLYCRAGLLTPNLPEAAALMNLKSVPAESSRELARNILSELGCGAVLLKGGHCAGETCTDILAVNRKSKIEITEHPHPKIHTPNTHGTGCTLSSAIACCLARGDCLPDAVFHGIGFLLSALEAGRNTEIGHGTGPLNHLFNHSNHENNF